MSDVLTRKEMHRRMKEYLDRVPSAIQNKEQRMGFAAYLALHDCDNPQFNKLEQIQIAKYLAFNVPFCSKDGIVGVDIAPMDDPEEVIVIPENLTYEEIQHIFEAEYDTNTRFTPSEKRMIENQYAEILKIFSDHQVGPKIVHEDEIPTHLTDEEINRVAYFSKGYDTGQLGYPPASEEESEMICNGYQAIRKIIIDTHKKKDNNLIGSSQG